MTRNNAAPASRKYIALIGMVFSVFLFTSLVYNLRQIHDHAVEKALTEARGIFNLNLAYRRWNAGHGGVYVPITQHDQPNPYLRTHPKRDITATDGTKLTVVNPAIMTRQVHQILSKSSPLPIINKVTSLKYINPDNAPDEWEGRALLSFEQGAKEASEIAQVNGQPYMRLLRPYMTEQGCLACHAMQGYKLGDVRGGLSIGIPMQPYQAVEARERKEAYLSHGLIWLMGMSGILLLGVRVQRTELKIIENEWKFRTLAESTSDWEYWHANDGRILFMSPSCEKITGYAPEAFILDPALVSNIVHPEDKGRWTAHAKDAQKAGQNGMEMTFRIIARGGAVKWLSHHCDPLPMGRQVSNRDITGQKKAEEALQQWAHIFEHAEWGVVVGSADGKTLELMNPAFATMHGYSVDELQGRPIIDVFAPESREELPQHIRLSNQKGHHTFESQHIRKDGTVFPVLLDVTVVKDEDGRVLYRVVNVQDITERRKLESQLRQAHKMEAIGHLAGGIAHDFNNILSAVVGYSSIMQRKMRSDDALRGYVEEVLAAGKRAAALTRSLLTFSRKQTMDLKPVNVNDIIRGFQKMLARIIGEDITIKTELTDEDLIVEADAGQIEQVFLNLATNARDAMPRGGTFAIATTAVDIDEIQSRLSNFGRPLGRYALITVADTGSGMDKDVLEHLFEPFYTTKGVGKGTGLGLSIVYGIVSEHNGVINIYSEPGAGAVFKIYLPLLARKLARESVEEPEALSGGHEIILLAEDEETVRRATRITLEEFGYTVIEAKDGEEAVTVFQENKDRVQLVLCDLIMPKKDGREALAEMDKIRHGVKALFMSGYTKDMLLKKGIDEEGMCLIAKPLNPGELLRKIREVLGPPK